jgi:hypothetical protein
MKIRLMSLGLASCFALVLSSSCNKLKDLVKVNVPLQTADISFTISPQPAGTQTLSGFQVVVNIDSILKAQNSSLSTGNIKSVKIKSCSLVALNATSSDHFGDLSACQVSLASDGSSYVKVAELTSNPDAFASSLELPVNDVELKDYFNTTVLKYQLSGTVRKATTTTLNCTATVKFDIEAGL